MHPRIPIDLAGAEALPVALLFQAERMADALDRIERRRHLDRGIDAALASVKGR